MIISSIKSGISNTWKNRRTVLVYYLANLIFGLLLMVPMYYLLNRFAGDTLMMQKLGGCMDMDFFFEFMIKDSTAISSFKGLLLVVPLLYWLFGLFLSAGAYSVILTDEKYSSSIFWGGRGEILR